MRFRPRICDARTASHAYITSTLLPRENPMDQAAISGQRRRPVPDREQCFSFHTPAAFTIPSSINRHIDVARSLIRLSVNPSSFQVRVALLRRPFPSSRPSPSCFSTFVRPCPPSSIPSVPRLLLVLRPYALPCFARLLHFNVATVRQERSQNLIVKWWKASNAKQYIQSSEPITITQQRLPDLMQKTLTD